MNKLQNDRKSRLKPSRNRYEKFVKDGKIYRYDRLNHRVSADSESSVPAEKNRAHEFSHAVLRSVPEDLSAKSRRKESVVRSNLRQKPSG